ncbi:Partner And Localizer Of Brca2 [Manis pentadactyla]|nr:Partner And Localizer Of Brca2 [Manis pentadactyla]
MNSCRRGLDRTVKSYEIGALDAASRITPGSRYQPNLPLRRELKTPEAAEEEGNILFLDTSRSSSLSKILVLNQPAGRAN